VVAFGNVYSQHWRGCQWPPNIIEFSLENWKPPKATFIGSQSILLRGSVHEAGQWFPLRACQPQDCPMLGWSRWYQAVICGHNLPFVQMDTTPVDVETYEKCLLSSTLKFLLIESGISCPNYRRDGVDMYLGFGKTMWNKQYVIQAFNQNVFIQAVNVMHAMHKCWQHVSQNKRSHCPLMESIQSLKYCVMPLIRVNMKLVVTTGYVELRKHLGTM